MRKSGIAYYCLPVMIALGLSHPQTPVSLHGSVQDSRTQAPIAGATVRLAGLGLSALTDTGGRFALTSASAVRKPLIRGGSGTAADPGTLRYRHDADGPVSIRILDFSGTERAVVFSGFLAGGDWSVSPPALPPGAYACAFETPRSRRTVRFLVSEGFSGSFSGSFSESFSESFSRSDADRQNPTGKSDRAAAKSASSTFSAAAQADADTLLVSKNGYRTSRLPLSDYQRTGLTVQLEDTSAADPDDATLIPDPSWTCYMPGGIPPPALGEAAFAITLQIGAIRDVGTTKFGRRRQYDIKGGAVAGSRINGTVLSGGLDYDLTLSNGSTEVEQIVILRADNVPILMRNAGVASAGSAHARVVLDFEAPNSSAFSWLNTGKFAATRIVDTAAKTIRLDVYEISKVQATAVKVRIQDPVDAPNQTWECVTLAGSQGSAVFTENVTLGTSISIGASKRGSRNIIPFTGGVTTGRVAGKILNGGADYQLGGLDARYTLAPDNGEFIIVRNCGSGGLVPVFEARVDGAYAFLNENKYLSSAPSVSGSSVSLTFYEKK
jgi:uncharacterized protein DUF3237